MKNPVAIPLHISDKILTIGTPYKEFKGGISIVINTYSKYFEKFNFLSSYKRSKSKIVVFFYYPYFVFKLFFYLLFKRQIKIVHIHGAAKGSIYRKYGVFFISKYIFGKKVVYHSHGSELKEFYHDSSNTIKRFLKHFFCSADIVICLSQQWKDFFVETFGVKQIAILENIVERNSATKPEFIPGNPVTFLFLGLIGARKGLFDLLEVLKDNRGVFEGKLNLLIGGRGEVKRLEDYIADNNLQTMVTFEGWIIGEKKISLLEKADVYTLPSYNEGLPISILEALSYKLPILTTQIGGIPEVVKENWNGFLLTPGDKPTLFEKLKWFTEHTGEIRKMGQNSQEIVKNYYADVVIPKLQQIYIELLKK
nr:glycosyltransferase family 4 protein [uncultured Mucilaginibacter sp.]